MMDELAGDATVEPPDLEAHLRALVPALCGGPPVGRILQMSTGVWLIERRGDVPVVVKQQLFGPLTRGTNHSLVAVEELVLGKLAAAGCPVPAVLGTDYQRDLILLEFVGELTLDDWIQAAAPAARRAMAGRLVGAHCAIHRTMALHTPHLRLHTAPGCDVEALATAWRIATSRAREGLQYLLGHEPTLAAEAQRILGRISGQCAAREPSLGTADYNARNVVIHATNAPRFIEFATLGWDWPERRLAQYGLPLGTRHPEGKIASVLDGSAAAVYQRLGGNPVALEQHHLVLLLNAVARLGRILAAPHIPENHALLRTWLRPRRRLRQLGNLLAAEWGADSASNSLRRCVQHGFVAGAPFPNSTATPAGRADATGGHV